MGDIDHLQFELGVANLLDGPGWPDRKNGAENLMSLNQSIQAAFQSTDIELPVNMPGEWDVIIRRSLFRLFQRPQPFLRQRERDRAILTEAGQPGNAILLCEDR